MSRLLQRSSLDKALDSQPPTPNPQPPPAPHWREDFPINWDDDHYITRREFSSFLTLISGALFLGTGLVGLREWWKRWRPARLTPVGIAQVTEVPVGGVKLFAYPTREDPCILIRTGAESYAAYSQKCTHLSCAVYCAKEQNRLECPCHQGFFSVADGSVIQGPPQRPLPRVTLAVNNGRIQATGMEGA